MHHNDTTVIVPLSQGKATVIDAEDAERVLAFKWYWSGHYAVRRERIWEHVGRKRRVVWMHHFLLGLSADERVDHVDRDGLNNRRSNLRRATQSQNMANRGLDRHNTSGYKGVSWAASNQKWMACIRTQRKTHYLGLFASVEDAARAYDVAAREIFGEFAYLNFPDE